MKKKISQLFALLIAFVMVLALAGCGGEPAGTPSSAPDAGSADQTASVPDAGEPAEEAGAQNVKIPQEELDTFCAKTAEELILEYLGEDPAASTPEQRMEFARAQRYSWLADYTDHYEMEMSQGYWDALDILEEQGVELPTPNEQFLAFAGSEYPTLRMAAFRAMNRSTADWDEETLALAKERIRVEDIYFVLGYMLDSLRDQCDDPEIADFFFAMTEHEDNIVRATTCCGLSRMPADRADAALETELKLLGDPDREVRAKAAMYADEYDERVLPGLEAILMNRDDADTHTVAMNSLKRMWFGFFGERHSAEAYALSLKYLRQTPRDLKVPDWFAVISMKMDYEDYQEWLVDAPYFDSAEFIEVLMAIAEDPDAHAFTRGDAVESAVSIASEEQIAAIGAHVTALTDDKAETILEAFEDAAAGRQE